MNQDQQKKAFKLLDLAKARLDKSGVEHEQIWKGFSLSAQSSGGKTWRPDPLANKVGKMLRASKVELKAWEIVSSLPSDQFDCVFIWHCVKRQWNPAKQKPYTVGDMLAQLTYKYYSQLSIDHGCRFAKPVWHKTQEAALIALADRYCEVFPPPKTEEQEYETQNVKHYAREQLATMR